MEVFKTRCLVKRDGKSAHQNADVIIMDGVPHLVMEWKITPEGETPADTLALEPKFFHRLHPSWGVVTHVYKLTIKDPRHNKERGRVRR